jgi:hypothetical protein
MLNTLLLNKIHTPYAVGFLVVKPSEEPSSSTINDIETYFSEDYLSPIFPSFQDRSNQMMVDFIKRLVVVVKQNPKIKAVYFHNLSRFDGILILKHMIIHHNTEYVLQPLMRNNELFEIVVYRKAGKTLLFRLKDSLKVLPGKLSNLANDFCPELGGKGSIPHETIEECNLSPQKGELLDYMKQDILLLGGVMYKAQYIFKTYEFVDNVTKLTISALAVTIFRTNYYDEINWPIHIPNRNEDTFIRRGYYGGHADTYIPKGKNLYYYDVNSLYPHIMKSYPMPRGKPVWHGNLAGQELDELHGFIEAYVKCPSNMKRPFLPYKKKDNMLLFPKGEFVGVYYSEELKYARTIGYEVIPMRGYLYDEKCNGSPFVEFVTKIFEKRQEAKRMGNQALAYIYKILMNSLYGRFGINPESTITRLCTEVEKDRIMKTNDFQYADKLNDDVFLVNYWIGIIHHYALTLTGVLLGLLLCKCLLPSQPVLVFICIPTYQEMIAITPIRTL